MCVKEPTKAQLVKEDVKQSEATSEEFFDNGMVKVNNEEKKIEYDPSNAGAFVVFFDFIVPFLLYKVGWHPSFLPYTYVAYLIQMTGALAVYHRFFAHRGYKAGRVWTAVMAIIGTLSGQGGPISWSDHHRLHHKHCDTDSDIHSPNSNGGDSAIGAFLWAQGGYLIIKGLPTEYHKRVPDWTRYPELVFIDWAADKIFFGVGILLWRLYGAEFAAYTFLLPTTLSFNCVQLVNSAVHQLGDFKHHDPLYPDCRARNVWWLTPLMLGANWHNNHHMFPQCARAGMEWYEIDPIYYIIKFWEALGLVYDLREPDMDKLRSLRVKEKEQSMQF